MLEVNQLGKKTKVLSVLLESSFVGRFQVWKIGEENQRFAGHLGLLLFIYMYRARTLHFYASVH